MSSSTAYRHGHGPISPVSWTKSTERRTAARPSWIGFRPAPATQQQEQQEPEQQQQQHSRRASAPPPPPPPPHAPFVAPGVDTHVAATISRPPPSGSGRSHLGAASSSSSGSGSYAALAHVARGNGSAPPIGGVGVGVSTQLPNIQTMREVELTNELDGMRAEVARLALLVASTRDRVLEETEPQVVHLAIGIASRLVGHELAADPLSIIESWVKEGLSTLKGSDESAIIVAVASDIGAMLPSDVSTIGVSKIVIDTSLRGGSVEVRDGRCSVQIGKDVRIAAMADALGVDQSNTDNAGGGES